MADLLTHVEFMASRDLIKVMVDGWLEPITKEQRVELMHTMLESYCQHCGDEQKLNMFGNVSYCQCENDD